MVGAAVATIVASRAATKRDSCGMCVRKGGIGEGDHVGW
jgi:hypothetical protein